MLTMGFSCGYSGEVTEDEKLPMPSAYISVNDAGSIVFRNTNRILQYWPQAFVGYNPIAAIEILSNGVVDGIERTTTATGLAWHATTSP